MRAPVGPTVQLRVHAHEMLIVTVPYPRGGKQMRDGTAVHTVPLLGVFGNTLRRKVMRKISIVLIGLLAAVMLPSVAHMTSTALGQGIPGLGRLRISIEVTNLDTGMPIKRRDTLTAVTPFQVTVTTNGIDCAGQFVVTALGDPSVGAPPSVLVQFIPFIIGPAVGNNSASGEPLDS